MYEADFTLQNTVMQGDTLEGEGHVCAGCGKPITRRNLRVHALRLGSKRFNYWAGDWFVSQPQDYYVHNRTGCLGKFWGKVFEDGLPVDATLPTEPEL